MAGSVISDYRYLRLLKYNKTPTEYTIDKLLLMIRHVSAGRHLKESNEHKFCISVHMITNVGDPQKHGGSIIDIFNFVLYWYFTAVHFCAPSRGTTTLMDFYMNF